MHSRSDLERTQARGLVEDLGGDHDLVGASACDESLNPHTHCLGPAPTVTGGEAASRASFLRAETRPGNPKRAVATGPDAAPQGDESLLARGHQISRLVVGLMQQRRSGRSSTCGVSHCAVRLEAFAVDGDRRPSSGRGRNARRRHRAGRAYGGELPAVELEPRIQIGTCSPSPGMGAHGLSGARFAEYIASTRRHHTGKALGSLARRRPQGAGCA